MEDLKAMEELKVAVSNLGWRKIPPAALWRAGMSVRKLLPK